MQHSKSVLSSLILLMVICSSTYANAGIVVVASQSNPLESLTKEDTRRIFVGRMRSYDDGSRIEVAHLKDQVELKTTFVKKATGLKLSKYHSRWAALLFSGRVSATKMMNDEKAMVEFLISKPNAIGYIYSENLTPDLKILFTVMP